MKRITEKVNLLPQLRESLKTMADIQHRSLSNLIEAMLLDALESKRQEYRETRQISSLDNFERTRNTRPQGRINKVDDIDDMPFEK